MFAWPPIFRPFLYFKVCALRCLLPRDTPPFNVRDMRSSYFLLFTLAAILPGLMLGAVLSRATSGTAAGARSVEAPAWPAPLEAGLASAPTVTPGQRGSEFGTKPASGSSEEPALALLQPQDVDELRTLIPSAPLGGQAPVAQPIEPRAPAPLPARSNGLPAPLKLEPLALPSMQPLQPLVPKGLGPNLAASTDLARSGSGEDTPSLGLSLPSLPTLTPVKPQADAPSLPLPQVASLADASFSDTDLEAPSAAGPSLARAPALPDDDLLDDDAALVMNFDPQQPETWLTSIETPGYRPPQFVLLSFEAASRNVFWDTSQDLARESTAQVTYFISASSLVLAARANSYTAPTGESGRAWLGFAKDRQELAGRLERIQDALAQGHDVAVQGVGYHRGQGWSIEQWQQELSQTQALVRGAYRDNGLSEPEGWQATADRLLSGFRAREQSGSGSLDAALQNLSTLRYNASGKQTSAQWPKREQGVWQLGLPMLTLDGGRRVLAQDYDFYLKQTNGQPNSAKSADHEEQMLSLLLAEMDQRYQSGRAPMLVSLHFALWNKGAYWRAVKRFAKRVCDQPEVVCTTHSALANYLDAVGEAKLARLAAADFPRFSGAGLSLDAPQALTNLPQVASLDKDANLRAEGRSLDEAKAQAASATAARLLSDEPTPQAAPLMTDGYVFDRLPEGLRAPIPAIKPQRIAILRAPSAQQPKAAAKAPASGGSKQAAKPLPLPFGAGSNTTTGTRSATTDALY